METEELPTANDKIREIQNLAEQIRAKTDGICGLNPSTQRLVTLALSLVGSIWEEDAKHCKNALKSLKNLSRELDEHPQITEKVIYGRLFNHVDSNKSIIHQRSASLNRCALNESEIQDQLQIVRNKAKQLSNNPTDTWDSGAAQDILKFLDQIQNLYDRRALLNLLRSLSLSMDAGISVDQRQKITSKISEFLNFVDTKPRCHLSTPHDIPEVPEPDPPKPDLPNEPTRRRRSQSSSGQSRSKRRRRRSKSRGKSRRRIRLRNSNDSVNQIRRAYNKSYKSCESRPSRQKRSPSPGHKKKSRSKSRCERPRSRNRRR